MKGQLTLAAVLALALFTACERRNEGGAAADTATTADTVHVTLREWSVTPARTSLSAGKVVFHVMNEGEYEHALEVEGAGEEKETDHIKPGETAMLEIDLKPGAYELYCPVEDTNGKHEQRGMRTTIEVR